MAYSLDTQADAADLPDLDLNMSFVIQPYMFEPPRRQAPPANADYIDSDSNSSSEDGPSGNRTQDVDLWCECGGCEVMDTEAECLCCTEIAIVKAHFDDNDDVSCITELEMFQDNCLNHNVITVSYYEYYESEGPFDDDIPLNESYRHAAYRRFVRWIWKRLGRWNRKILPSCVVMAIRNAFPSDNYTGFRPAPGHQQVQEQHRHEH